MPGWIRGSAINREGASLRTGSSVGGDSDAGHSRSTLREIGVFARRNPVSAASGVIGLLIILVAITAPLIAPRDPLKADFRRLGNPPGSENYFGTDQIGRDTLSRIIYGARSSIFVAFSAVLLGTTLGSLWGLASGYLGGRFDLFGQRLMEILQSFPDLILAMAISMAIGTGMQAVIVAIAITRIPFGGRVIRSVALTVKELPYVEASRSTGASHLRIMALHVLPQCLAPYLVLATTHPGGCHCHRGRPGVSGGGNPAPDSDMGQHAGGLVDVAGSTLVAGVFPRPRDHGHGPGVQPCRRRDP